MSNNGNASFTSPTISIPIKITGKNTTIKTNLEIPHAALIANRLKLPMGFVRSKAKDHGKAKQIEGEIFPGAKALVIEDLFSTGGSSIEAAKVCQEAGFDVIGVLSIFTYDLDRCQENFRKAGLDHYSASNLTELFDLSVERGDISTGERQEILTWKESL